MEKRQFYRHPLKVPIQYQAASLSRGSQTSSVDLSQGGLSFLADRFFAKGTVINLTIPVGEELFKLQGHVAYCNREAAMDRYRTGVAFMNAVDAFQAKLAEQMHRIREYRAKRSRELHEELSEEQAADEWIQKYARHFSYLF